MPSCSPMTNRPRCSAWKIRIRTCLRARHSGALAEQANPESGAGLSRRRKRIRTRHGPGVAEAAIFGPLQELAGPKRRIKLRERADLGGGGSLGEVDRPQILRMFETGCR